MKSIRQYIPNKVVNIFWHLPKAVLANIIYGFPGRKLTVIGITGTSGKTSVCHILDHILRQAGFKVKLISSISSPGLHVTNPEPFVLQKLIRRALNQGKKYLILEVTSHGLDQYRVWGIKFAYGLITNITHEHLDYHKTFERYRQTKLKLLKISRIQVKFPPADDFLRANQNAARALAVKLGVKKEVIDQAIETFPGALGRMEFVQKKPFTIVIDFAHKPDALEKALQYLRKKTSGRLIAIFGCAGLRDVAKRPIMGRIACRLADKVILTAEDPRTEDVHQIIKEIASGCPQAEQIPDRQEAINRAVEIARSGDTVVCFGKSHEKSMCFGKIEYPWSEHQAVKKALKLCKH